jgi:hypothetical protein
MSKNLMALVVISSCITGIATAFLAPTAAQAEMSVTWDTNPVIQVTGNPQPFNANLSANADRLFFRADGGQVTIEDIQLQADDGSTLGLSDLMADPTDKSNFGAGVVDDTGSTSVPRFMTLNLPAHMHLVSLGLTLGVANGSSGALYMSVLSGTSSATPTPAPTQTLAPSPACDLGSLNQQLGACTANQQNNQSQITQLFGEERALQGQITGMSQVSSDYNACLQDNQNLSLQQQQLRAQVQQLTSDKQNLDADTQSKQAMISQLSRPQPKGYNCWIIDRHGNRYNSSGLGTQIDVLKPLLTNPNETGAGNIGKQNWTQNGNWGCTPQ